MKPTITRRCRHCVKAFHPDYRNAHRQRFCGQSDCQRASKRASQRRWLSKAANRDYFRGPENVERVRRWRGTHAGYWRNGLRLTPPGEGEVAPLTVSTQTGVADAVPEGDQPDALQDLCRSKCAVLTALLWRLSRCALQEDIAEVAAQVVSETQRLLLRCAPNLSAPASGGECPEPR